MSGQYVSRVFESDLPPDLKFTAAVLASFADEDGRSIWPALGYVAYLRGVSERAVQFHLKDLRMMNILVVVHPATQWRPTHYRIAADKLPTRTAYQPPDRQQSFLGPPGTESGVKPPSPLPGVKYSAPGVKPTSPDPSQDPSLHTRTARAREAEVKPASPLRDHGLPLIVAPTRHPDHKACAWCGRVCVPKFLHKSFKKALGGPVTKRAARLRAFYSDTLAAIAADRDIGDEPLKFWRAAFAVKFGSVGTSTDHLTARELEDARHTRSHVYNGCPHDPRCQEYAACVREIAWYFKYGT